MYFKLPNSAISPKLKSSILYLAKRACNATGDRLEAQDPTALSSNIKLLPHMPDWLTQEEFAIGVQTSLKLLVVTISDNVRSSQGDPLNILILMNPKYSLVM